MIGLTVFALFAAMAAQAPAVEASAEAEGVVLAADSALLAEALSIPMLQLTMRGTSVVVMARAAPAEGGCAALVSARAPSGSREWSRLFRWSEVAWAGTAPDGRTMVSFFEHEGRLPADTLVAAPPDPGAFRAALSRLTVACRATSDASERILMASRRGPRSCYFARLPSLLLMEEPASAPPRAMLSVLSRENPQGELQVLLERDSPGSATGEDEWSRPAIAFIYADPRLKDMRIAGAGFALDARPVAAQHALAAYGDTRLRIGMDPSTAPAGDTGADSFYRRLAASGEARLTLLDAAGQARAVLNFDAGPALAAARKALKAAGWSCAGAVPASAPAAIWRPAAKL